MPTNRSQVNEGQGSRRSWLLVAALAASETTSYGVLAYAFAVVLVPMQQELGWSRTALTGAYSAAIIVSGLAAIPVGRWLDGHGARALMTSGSAAATLLVLAWAQVSNLTAFYAIWVGIGMAIEIVVGLLVALYQTQLHATGLACRVTSTAWSPCSPATAASSLVVAARRRAG
jgi:MFS family permease